jgi:putative endonuclease
MKKWFVYIIRSDDNYLYTGISTNVERRWKEHSSKKKPGARFFRGRSPKQLLYIHIVTSRQIASQKEAAIKRLSKKEKIQCIASKENQIKIWRLSHNTFLDIIDI